MALARGDASIRGLNRFTLNTIAIGDEGHAAVIRVCQTPAGDQGGIKVGKECPY